MLFFLLALSSASGAPRTHYGDPNVHPLAPCLKDEVKAQITGLAGDLCIPPCSQIGTCPQDKPAGATAEPQCVLTSSNGAKYCALVCTAEEDAQCGPKASCKKGDKEGLCTFDDIPPPPSSEHWKPVISPTFQQQSVVLGVGFTKDGVTGYAGAGSNGVGAQVIKSTDAGVTWAAQPETPRASFNIYLDAKVASAKHAVVSGVIAQEHTVDGDMFFEGGPFLCPAQDIGILPESGAFALVGQCANGNGVYLSKDGAKYKEDAIPMNVLNETFEIVRYGAFPSENTWYITAGAFPNTPSPPASPSMKNGTAKRYHRATHRVTVHNEGYTLATEPRALADPAPVNCDVDPSNCFAGAVVKTTDGGKSWTKVWENVNTGDNIYSNGISCATEDHCVTVAEGDSAQIRVTRDGGKTWNVTMDVKDAASSLIAVRMLDQNEVWVSGGEMNNQFSGHFWHSLDGGDSWTLEAIKGLYIFSFDMVSRESGYSVALTRASGVELLKYKSSGDDAVVFNTSSAPTKKAVDTYTMTL